ncbi:hypothetical protein HELRODRAFT_190612 [Helobdella robusta]|uniref:Exonuclease 3'-5' domain-containing protein 2 n=1 Tax=Helobdella robusta TaxID=6412 RepID=T1FS48_HELRO|nr:hypothetical protein HELRODRAFT_190612 [Helobdella robusta]ESO08802.1 hypothetical protein HELRODRAFT_190612 [Helobdella robusta]
MDYYATLFSSKRPPDRNSDHILSIVLGFDCEWCNNGDEVRPISLIQLSTSSGLCLLIRIKILLDKENVFPQSLADILRDKRILKVGVASIEDGQKLHRDYNIECKGCLDLRYVVLRCRLAKISPGGLKYLSKAVLGIDLSKNIRIRCGNWESDELNDEQIFYAAMDSLVSIKIFQKLVDLQYSHNKEIANITNNLILKNTASSNNYTKICQGIVDIKYKNKAENKFKIFQNCHITNSRRDDPPNFKEAKPTRAYNVRKEPLYQNCKLFSNDGQLLCTCDEKKALWYIDKKIGEKISDNPLTVKLLFEPAGRPTSESDYYLQEKDNRCVVCGLPESYIRKNIIPHEYRKHFPVIFKEHKSHDVVLLCSKCHLISNQYDSRVKFSLARKYDATIRSDKYVSSAATTKVKSAAKALYNDRGHDKIPTQRQQELRNCLKEYFKVDEFYDELVDRGFSLDVEKQINENFEEHGLKVTRSVIAENGLIKFERMWRQHFLDSMKPAYMPNLWSVNHGHDRLLRILPQQQFLENYKNVN